MSIKTTGAEWNAFYADKEAWPKGAWHEDEDLTIDGKWAGEDYDLANIAPAAAVSVSGGIVYLDGAGAEGPSLESHFRTWRKKQSTARFSCEAPINLADAVKAAIVAAGGKVVA